MGIRRAAVNAVLKGLLDTICKIDSREFTEVLSRNDPLIVAINHINFLEAPILVTHSYPLPMTGIVKAETWDNPFIGFLASTYRAISIDRAGAFQETFKKVKKAIDSGFFVCIAPEGTRSKNGVLGRGRAGIIQLAQYTDAAILPVVHYGGENIWKNIRRLKRTGFRFRAGSPFRIKFSGRPDREEREAMLGEVMGQMAKLLPEPMRGPYAADALRECKYLEFIGG